VVEKLGTIFSSEMAIKYIVLRQHGIEIVNPWHLNLMLLLLLVLFLRDFPFNLKLKSPDRLFKLMESFWLTALDSFERGESSLDVEEVPLGLGHGV
jgi:hypothetical protein